LSLSTPLSITLDSTMVQLLSTSFPYLRTLKFDVERMEDAESFFLQLADQSTVIDLQINCYFGDNERDYSFLDYIHFNTQLRCLSITNDQSTNNRGSIYQFISLISRVSKSPQNFVGNRWNDPFKFHHFNKVKLPFHHTLPL